MPDQQPFIVVNEQFRSMIEQLAGLQTDAFLSAMNEPAATSVFYNRARGAGHRMFDSEPVPWCEDGGFLSERPQFTFDPMFHAGCYYVMEASSMFIAHVTKECVSSDVPVRALDLCGAPGGKSVILLSSLPAGGLLVSNESIRSRWHTLQYNLDKWGYPNVVRINSDPAAIPWDAMFDFILVDAPCSGEGLFRKDIAAREQWSPQHVQHCAARQRRILHDAVRLLTPGGTLVYSTCTFNDIENIDQVVWLASTYDLEPVEITLKEDWNLDVVNKDGFTGYRFFPHKVKGEGFFCSVLHKPGSAHAVETSGHRRKRNTQNLLSNIPDSASAWLETREEFGRVYFYQAGPAGISMLQTALDVSFLDNMSGLRIGTDIGQIKSGKFTPAHALALSLDVAKDSPSVELDRDQAIAYLRKDPVSVVSGTEGWNLATFQGKNLGWVKQTQAGLKNYLPTHLRIVKAR